MAELGKERPVLQKSLLHLILTELAGGGKDISSLHVQKLRELFDRQVGRCLDFPYDIRAERVYQGIILRKCTGEEGRKQNFPELTARGFWQIPGYGYEIRTRLIEKNFQNEEIPKKMYTKWMDYDKIKGTMQLRTRQEQDFLVLGPDGRRKKLKKYFVDEKIPRQERDRILLLADGSHILWVIGYRISEEIKVTEHTRRILEIQVDGGTAYE